MDIIDKIFETLLKEHSKATLAIIAAFVIFLKMLYDLFGLEYLTMTKSEMVSDWGTGVAIGEFLPFDIGTLLIGAIAIWFVNYGMDNGGEFLKLGKIAKYGAIVIMVLSFTHVPTVLSALPRAIAGATDDAKIYDSQQHYEEFAQYVDVSASIALTGDASKEHVEAYLQEHLTDLGKQEVKKLIAEEVRDYIKITVEFNDFGKKDLIYSMAIEELDYPTAYYQMKYYGRTVLGCEMELNFNKKLNFKNMSIRYPSMMNHVVNGVDTFYGYAKGDDGQGYTYNILMDSSSMYKAFAPYLCNKIPNQMSALPDYCKEMVYHAANFYPGKGAQSIETSETKEINGIPMQRTTGVLVGSQYGANDRIDTYRYVAYYFFVEEDDGFYPAVMVAIGNEQIASEVEYYMDQLIEHVSETETGSVDSKEF